MKRFFCVILIEILLSNFYDTFFVSLPLEFFNQITMDTFFVSIWFKLYFSNFYSFFRVISIEILLSNFYETFFFVPFWLKFYSQITMDRFLCRYDWIQLLIFVIFRFKWKLHTRF